MTDKYAVVGNPVAHSLSPKIHAAFRDQTGEDISYEKILAPLDAFKATVLKFRDEGGRGVNVTLPFKHAAWNLVNYPAVNANDAEAVNTIAFQGSNIVGHNTDGIGLVTDLERNLGFLIHGKRVLVMGAGGATYGVVHPVLDKGPALLVVANRTLDKAITLVKHFNKLEKLAIGGMSAKPYSQLAGSQFDLVINATSAGLTGEMPALPTGVFGPGALAYEMVYGRQTPFMNFAREQGAAQISDGLGMLVEQAAASFQIWRNVRPRTAPVIKKLRGQN